MNGGGGPRWRKFDIGRDKSDCVQLGKKKRLAGRAREERKKGVRNERDERNEQSGAARNKAVSY